MKFLQPSFRENQYWQIIKRHRILGTTALMLVSILGIIFTTQRNPVYEAQAKLQFKSSSWNSSLKDNNQLIGNLYRLINKNDLINTEIEIINSRPLIEKTISSLNWENENSAPIDVAIFRQNLRLNKLGDTNILQIKYKDTNPVKAKEAVNQLIFNYLENSTTNQEEGNSKKEEVEEHLSQVEKQLQQTEEAIRKIQEETKILEPQEEAMIVVKNLALLQRRIGELQGEIANVNAQSAYIRSQLGMDSRQALAATTISQSSDIQQAFSQLRILESELAQKKRHFIETSPIITDLEDRIAGQKQLIQQKIKNIPGSEAINLSQAPEFSSIKQNLTTELVKLEASNQGLREQITYFSALEKAQEEKVNLIPQVLQQIQRLKRELAASQADYESLRQQIRNIAISRNFSPSNIRVISYATVPKKPIRPQYVGYLASVGLGCLGATLMIALAEITDYSLKNIEEAKQIFGYTWLGIIPDNERVPILQTTQLNSESSLPRIIVRDYPAGAASESYRMLQSNIKFLSTYKELKTIVVTSSVSQEGKSTVAANLACGMAQAGHKVLLIDGNLHNPLQHQIWKTTSERGLSNVITEKIDAKLVTQEVFPRLYLISSGMIPSSPATLLDSSRMKEVVDNWRKSYDFVIIDTPALDLAADAPILGRIADGVLLVVRPDRVHPLKASFAKELLQKSGQNVLGIVFNKINPQAESKNYFYHALEERPEDASQPRLIEQSQEELWLAISRMSQKSKKPKLARTSQEILATPVKQLQEIITCLQQDLKELTKLVKEQEEELFMQSQMVKKLQKSVNLSKNSDRYFLEQKLLQEQERKNMLNATLIGQIRNLKRKQQMLLKYHQVLSAKQTESSLNIDH
ncbi:MAG: polysaccharide biosynthesis tyrosine autokinase [Xenococcaceae cyanobacterium MO_207.B15]|nr:polysaccharide biosynthesis tyrosine autokinase [Xenococcaceae cyanobacterium MO_207.B15]MDJ0741927.1 polysaccharide biosynthesis tyrosine autokinase [Xenococcaceae cyanobacterium MO_167.B27]